MNRDEEFRQEFRSWLEEHPPPQGIEVPDTDEEIAAVREWHRTMHAGGWVGIHWPKEHGGRGAAPAQVAIYNQELSRAGAPPLLARGGLSLVGPTLISHGTEEQRKKWMPRILEGEDTWCQLFSEPDAGSDLASLQTKAEKHGGVYIVNGQKVWTSYAKFANYGIALVRTDPDAPNHKGISMLAVPMKAKGVEIRPLRQITGAAEFFETFLTDVEVPVENLIGPENDGWRVTNTTLANERGASFVWREQMLHEVALSALIERCRKEGLAGDPIVRQGLAQSYTEVEILRLHNARTLERLARDEELGPLSSVVKLFWANLSQRMYHMATSVLGPGSLLMPGADDAIDDGRWVWGFLESRSRSIMGGTSEIQHNILGERILGLPREPR